MECFTDGQGQFVFPSRLFPELPDATAAPPSVAARRAAIEREFRVLKGAGLERSFRWAVDVFQFHDTWGDVRASERGADMLAQARRVLEKLAAGTTQFAGAANYRLGLLATSDSESRVHFRTALKKGCERAWYRVGAKAEARGEHDSAVSRFRRGASRGDSACLYTLGLAHIKGHLRLRRNAPEGLRLLEDAVQGSDADFPHAPYVVGKILLGEGGDVPNGLGLPLGAVTVDRARGLRLVQQAAFLGFAPALARMGQARQTKEFGFDCAVALRYTALAAEQEAYRRFRRRRAQLHGDPEANIVKWLLCGYKDVIRVNEPWAFRFAEVGAAERNGTALFALGYFYEVGVNTDTDAAKALEYYRAGAREGCAAASARLEQMATNKPQLQRTLTRRDHDAKLRKHRTALISGEGDAGLAAINDQSTLEDDAPSKVPSPIPEAPPPSQLQPAQPSLLRASQMQPSQSQLSQPPQPQPAPPQQLQQDQLPRKTPYPDSPDRTPQQSVAELGAPPRRLSFSSLSSGPSLRSVASHPSPLPYPVDEPQPTTGASSLQQFGSVHSAVGSVHSAVGSMHSAASGPLPYPDERPRDTQDPNVPLQFAGSLPYPRSPESPRLAARPSTPSSDQRLTAAVQASSIEDHSQHLPQVRSFSSGPGVLAQNSARSPPRSSSPSPAGFRRGHGVTMSVGNLAAVGAPSRQGRQGTPDSSSRSFSVARVPVGKRADLSGPSATDAASAPAPGSASAVANANAGASAQPDGSAAAWSKPTPPRAAPTSARGPPSARSSLQDVIPQGASWRTGPHTVADSAPVSARTSLHASPGSIPNLAPSMPTSGSDTTLNSSLGPPLTQPPASGPRYVSLSSSPPALGESPDLRRTPASSQASSRHGSVSPTSSLASGDRSPPGSPDSKGSPPGSPRRRRKARPLSAGWVRESFLPGANRFFSMSQPDVQSTGGSQGYVDAGEPDAAVRQRSPSPLRKMFKSAEQRHDHRSVTDSAVLNKPRGPDPALANVPKVPVQPIKEEREPGVAYTFEDMGVTAVTSTKNDKCIIA